MLFSSLYLHFSNRTFLVDIPTGALYSHLSYAYTRVPDNQDRADAITGKGKLLCLLKQLSTLP
jgi:hypothetical protein